MTLEINNNEIIIKGNLTETEHFTSTKEAIESVIKDHSSLIIKFYDTLVINSSLIGYLVNTIHSKSIEMSIHTNNATLYELVDYLGMRDIFNLKKI